MWAKTAFAGTLATLALFVGTPSATAEEPNAQQILAMVRANQSSQNREYSGRLLMSTDDGRIVIPFRLNMRGSTIAYQFSNPSEALVLHLGDKSTHLERITGSGHAQTVSGAKLDAPVRGTDISYEDLALKFLYWRNAKVTGEDNLGVRHCWVIQATPSGKDDSQYDMVRLWVEKSGGLMKAECYQGKSLVRRFQVKSVQHAPGGDGYILKTLSVQRLDKKGGADHPTYLEINPV